MSGNKVDGHSTSQLDPVGKLQRLLDLLWIKLDERFLSIADAFRYFDKNYNNRVTFGDFLKTLDHLRIRF
jgi:hypothetical protein